MAAPTFVQEAETSWAATTATTKTTASFSVLAGDVLVAYMMSDIGQNSGTLTASGGSLTWTQQVDVGTGATVPRTTIATAVVDADKSMTVTATRGTGSFNIGWGVNVLTFRNAQSTLGAKNSLQSTGAPSLSITTTGDNSALVVVNSDTAAVDGTSRTWRTGAGTFTEQTYDRTGATFTFYGGFHADAGTAGTDTVGLSAPAGQTYSIGALEVLGAAAAPSGTPREPTVVSVVVMRASLF